MKGRSPFALRDRSIQGITREEIEYLEARKIELEKEGVGPRTRRPQHDSKRPVGIAPLRQSKITEGMKELGRAGA